jgi:hypothetical protein
MWITMGMGWIIPKQGNGLNKLRHIPFQRIKTTTKEGSTTKG